MNCPICGAELAPGALFCGHCGSTPSARPDSASRTSHRRHDTIALQRSTGVVSVPVGAAQPTPMAPGVRPRFQLEFSTGQTATVFGHGLIGRNPVAKPGEQYDHLVQIDDPALSVSKTHLEFGEHDGEFWILDRFSTNGTVMTRPGSASEACAPGIRCGLPRGSRIDLSQVYFFVR